MAQQPQPPIGTSAVRRHHTVSSSSGRPTRVASGKMDVHEEHAAWRDDEEDPVIVAAEDPEWIQQPASDVNLHRQASLPARYNRGLRAAHQQAPPLNSLSAIQAAHGIDDGLEDAEFEREMLRGWGPGAGDDDDDQGSIDNRDHGSPINPQFSPDSPAAAAAGVRRVQSLTYQGRRQPAAASGLKRSGTASAKPGRRDHPAASPPLEPEEDEVVEYAGPWPNSHGPGGAAIDDVQRALAGLNVSGGVPPQRQPPTPPSQPPRFMPYTTPLSVAPGQQLVQGQQDSAISSAGTRKQHLQLVTNLNQPVPSGTANAASFLHQAQQSQQQQQQQHVPPPRSGASSRNDERAITVSGLVWDQKDRALGSRNSSGSLNYSYNNSNAFPGAGNIPPMPPIPAQYLGQSSGHPGPQPGGPPRMATLPGYPQSAPSPQPQPAQIAQQTPVMAQNILTSPIDVPSLVASKGYNPTSFDIRPEFARYFVIKSYTEDDVHKSLKYEIWSSTEPGNKRLDKAFKETAGRGPIYLFFSVNGSGHFCGMAEMLTPVDLTRSSTVWASDKWKGVFKVRWIFVRDIPNSNLRHIRLNNTQERKPVTNSRDTQELLPDAGHEMLRIFFTHQSRTSLLQDFAFYELQSLQKQTQPGVGVSPSPSPGPPVHQPLQQQYQPQQGGFNGGNQNQNYLGGAGMGGYGGQQNLPLPGGPQNIMGQMGLPIGPIGSPYNNPQTIQSVMRNPSPGPGAGGAYMNLQQGHY